MLFFRWFTRYHYSEYNNIFTFISEIHTFICFPITHSVQSCPIICNPMDGSMPGFPVHHQVLKVDQTHVHQVGDAIQPSHPLPFLSPPAFKFPSIKVFSNESVVHIRWSKYWNFSFSISPSMNIEDWFPLGLTGLISLLSKGLSIVFSNTTVQKHLFFRAQPPLWSMVQLSHPYMTVGKTRIRSSNNM